MIKILKYFFYKIYSVSLSNGEKDAGWAMTIVSIFVLLNMSFLIDIILIITGARLPQVGKVTIGIICAIILYMNYSLLMKGNRANEIIKEFNEMKTGKGLLNVCLILYIVLTIVLFIYTANIIRNR